MDAITTTAPAAAPADGTEEIKGLMVGPGKNFPWGQLRFIETETEKVRAFGKEMPTVPGLLYTMTGNYQVTPRYGQQFLVKSWTVSSYSKEEIMNILKDIPGIGQKTAEAVYETFGEDTLLIIRTQPDRLDEAPIDPKYADTIRRHFNEKARLSRLYKLLIPYGFSAALCRFVNSQFGERSETIIRALPYSLCSLPGFTFPTVDAMAVGEGHDRYDPVRILAGLYYLLEEHEHTGDVSMDASEVYRELPVLLGTKPLDIFQLVKESGDISCHRLDGKLRYARAKTLRAERAIARHIFEISGHRPMSPQTKEELVYYMISVGMDPKSDQARALVLAASESFCCITGGPGTGKTTLIRHIATWVTEYEQQPVLCIAPTGMAAKRIRECTGLPAFTIHSALGMTDEGKRTADLNSFCVIVDEASMVDVFLMSELMSANPDRLILVGDASQLASVGPGAVFRDVLDSPYVPGTELCQVYRYSEGSKHILGNASLISTGIQDLQTGAGYRAFYGLENEELEEKMLTMYLEGVEEFGLDEVCLISPVKDGPAGVKSLNARARDILNPPAPEKNELTSGKTVFRCGDRVMETRNHGTVVNGDIGYILKIGKEGVVISFLSGEMLLYPPGEMYHIVHAYAMTVHKAQGSEYQMVVTCLQDHNRHMIRRSIIYTAFTRGKTEVVYCGSKAALDRAIETDDRNFRKTALPDAIIRKFTGPTLYKDK